MFETVSQALWSKMAQGSTHTTTEKCAIQRCTQCGARRGLGLADGQKGSVQPYTSGGEVIMAENVPTQRKKSRILVSRENWRDVPYL